jgi:hypothetical protein
MYCDADLLIGDGCVHPNGGTPESKMGDQWENHMENQWFGVAIF